MSTTIRIRNISSPAVLGLTTEENVSVARVLGEVIQPMLASGQLGQAVEFKVSCSELTDGKLNAEQLSSAANEAVSGCTECAPWVFGDRAPRSTEQPRPVPPPKVVRKLELVPS